MRLQVNQVSSKLFSYDAANKTFSADLSDFYPMMFRQLMDRVYDDACDIGFEIVSERTGEAELFCFTGRYLYDAELQYVKFSGTGKHADLKVIIFND